jgi:prepilin-type N-terminal cleavage/methylation domain-containing protein
MRKSGFTLIELLMVSVILAVLAAIAIPNFTRSQQRAKEVEVKSVAHALQMAVEDYKATPGWEGLKPSNAAELNLLLINYLPSNIQLKRNPFLETETYGSGGGGVVFGGPGATPGHVGYNFTFQNAQYTILANGGDNRVVLILTLIEGQ